jgi:hypothetical protein
LDFLRDAPLQARLMTKRINLNRQLEKDSLRCTRMKLACANWLSTVNCGMR